ncbi:hypothetical protein Tco_0547468 [Tanacetum coccineum]
MICFYFNWFDDDEVVPIPPVVPITPVNVPAAPAPENAIGSPSTTVISEGAPAVTESLLLFKYLFQTLKQKSSVRWRKGYRRKMVLNLKTHLIRLIDLEAIRILIAQRSEYDRIAGFSNSQRHLYHPIQICSESSKVGFDSCKPIDTQMAERPNLVEDKGGKLIDISRYLCGSFDTLKDVRLHGEVLLVQAKFLGLRLVSCVIKKQKSSAISHRKLNTTPISRCCVSNLDAFSTPGIWIWFTKFRCIATIQSAIDLCL